MVRIFKNKKYNLNIVSTFPSALNASFLYLTILKILTSICHCHLATCNIQTMFYSLTKTDYVDNN